MVNILAAIGRSRSNRKRDERPLSDRFSWSLRSPDVSADELDDGVVVAPRMLVGRILSWVGMALCVALFASIAVSYKNYSIRTRQFQVNDFEVVGNHRLSAEAVIDASGVRNGNGLFRIDLAEIRGKLEQLPWVRQAKAQKRLPATLVLEVEEYVPVVLVANNEMMLADDACHLIARPERGGHASLPVVTGIEIDHLQRDPPNAATLLAQARLRRAIDIVGAWPHSERFALGEVNWDPVRGITLLSADDGAEIRVGHATGEELQRRFRQIDALLADVQRRGKRLRYALLDDATRPGQAVVRATDPSRWSRFLGSPPRATRKAAPKAAQDTAHKPAGPRARQAPQGARIQQKPATAEVATEPKRANKAEREKTPGGR